MNRYVLVREGDFEPETEAYYAGDLEEAQAKQAELMAETGSHYRIAILL